MNKITTVQPLVCLFVFLFSMASCFSQSEVVKKPNIVLIFTDDQGYGDLGCFGNENIKSPNIDKMASEGVKMTNFYVPAPLCTPSRAGLMTGCYPSRIDMADGSTFPVLLAADTKGLNPKEITLAEILKSVGYKTGMFGKWHLGDQPEFLPTRQGFDEFFGLPYSHDIHPYHPKQATYDFPPLPLLNGEKVIETDPDADYLTQRITEHALNFIQENKNQPFFLYVPHPIPHRPVHMSPPFMKAVPDSIRQILKKEDNYVDYATRDNIYNEAIREIDWSVGQILETLKNEGIDDNTLVIFTSDNGPAIAGSAGPLRGRKGSTFEGGMREPTIIRWPGKIPAGQINNELATTMDFLPTIAKICGAKVPDDRIIDGKDIWPVLTEEGKSPHKAFFYYKRTELQAVRSGKWKLFVKGEIPTELYDLENDISESKNVLDENPTVVKRLLSFIKTFKEDLNANNRPAAFVADPVPLTMQN